MRRVVTVVIFSLVLISCGSSGGSAVCRELQERLDPTSFLHVINPSAADFLTDPPTSGPHVSGPVPVGVLDTPIVPAIQVSLLESGAALVQYDPALAPGDIDALVVLARPGVVVAPGEDLPAPVVATAWTWKLTCDGPDQAIDRFIDRRVGDAPGSD